MNYVKSLISKDTMVVDPGKTKMEKTTIWRAFSFAFTSFMVIKSCKVKWRHTVQDVEDRDH
jgi:hypothetical protein